MFLFSVNAKRIRFVEFCDKMQPGMFSSLLLLLLLLLLVIIIIIVFMFFFSIAMNDYYRLLLQII